MSRNRLCLTLLSAPALVWAAVLFSGCGMGYTQLKPGENSGYYASLFHDIISSYDEPHWLWIRGTASMDYDGDGKTTEEAVVATIQAGTEKRPGPIESAFLLICRIGENGERTTVARTMLFDSSPFKNAPRPENDLGMFRDVPLTRVRAQVVEDKVSLKETIVVYFWGDEQPGSAWYAGFCREDEKLTKVLETVLWQNSPGLLVTNLDRRIEASRFGYQLVVGVAAIPTEIMRKIDPAQSPPLWGHVFARDDKGFYRQADARYAEHYSQLEGQWNQVYLKAVMHGLPDADLAWFEYHLGILNYYIGNVDMASRFLNKAARNAEDDTLRDGANRGIQILSEPLPPRAPVRLTKK